MNNSPECCQKCRYLKKNGACSSLGIMCPKWLEWFYSAWAGIQKAARLLKQKKTQEENQNEQS